MNPPISVTVGSADPNAAPLTVNDLFTLLQTVISAQIVGSYIPYIIGSATPSVDDQDKAWIQLDSSGRPIATKIFYSGTWRRIYNGMIGEIRMFFGDPGYNTTGAFDVNGHGNVGGDYDGWQICNGLNGAPDFTNQFPLGANMNVAGKASGYNLGWQAMIAGVLYTNGGQWTETLLPSNIPLPITQPVLFDKYSTNSAGEHSDPAGLLFGVNNSQHATLVPKYPPDPYPGNPSPVPVFIGPPFAAVAFIIFQGYNGTPSM